MTEELFGLWNPQNERYESVTLIEDAEGDHYLNFVMGQPEWTTTVLNKAEILLGARGLELDEENSFLDEYGIIEVPVVEVT